MSKDAALVAGRRRSRVRVPDRGASAEERDRLRRAAVSTFAAAAGSPSRRHPITGRSSRRREIWCSWRAGTAIGATSSSRSLKTSMCKSKPLDCHVMTCGEHLPCRRSAHRPDRGNASGWPGGVLNFPPFGPFTGLVYRCRDFAAGEPRLSRTACRDVAMTGATQACRFHGGRAAVNRTETCEHLANTATAGNTAVAGFRFAP